MNTAPHHPSASAAFKPDTIAHQAQLAIDLAEAAIAAISKTGGSNDFHPGPQVPEKDLVYMRAMAKMAALALGDIAVTDGFFVAIENLNAFAKRAGV